MVQIKDATFAQIEWLMNRLISSLSTYPKDRRVAQEILADLEAAKGGYGHGTGRS